MLNEETKAKARGRLRRIEGQVQGLQRMLENDAYCVDILLQISAVQGALEQCQKLLLGRHIESCVADAMRSGSRRSEEHTSELQSRLHLVCRLLLEKKKKKNDSADEKSSCC